MDSRLFLEFLQHSDKKPHTIRPRKDLFDHFDDEKFKSTVTKLLEQVGIPADCAEPQSFIFLSIFVYFTFIAMSACRHLFVFNDITNYTIGLSQGHASL